MEPDIKPLRLSAVDIISLSPVEAYAVLVHLAGDRETVVATAVTDAVRQVLARTRGGEEK